MLAHRIMTFLIINLQQSNIVPRDYVTCNYLLLYKNVKYAMLRMIRLSQNAQR